MASRNRGFAFVLYPDSAPENWRSIIDEFHVAWAESPLHDLDVDPGTGALKKPHWHIVLNFDSVKSLDQVKKLIEPLHGTIPIPLNSVRGMVRYFAHLDNPEKYQDLQIRVSGWNVLWNNINKEEQDGFIHQAEGLI